MNTLTMHCTVFLLVLLFPGFSLRPLCGSEQRTDRRVVIKRYHNSSLLLSDSAVTCPSSDSFLLGLAHCLAKTCPSPSRDIQDEGPTELELSVCPQLTGQKPLPSAAPGRLWPQMAHLWEQWENLSSGCTGFEWSGLCLPTPCFQVRKRRPTCHRILSSAFPTTGGYQRERTQLVPPGSYDLLMIYAWLSASHQFVLLSWHRGFYSFETAPSSNYEHGEESNTAASVWAPAPCLQRAWGCERAQGRRSFPFKYGNVMRTKDKERG